MHQIGIFISHSWTYGEHYQRLGEWIFSCHWHVSEVKFRFIDYSIPKDDPIHNARNQQELQSRIYAEMRKSHVVVIPTGLYASHSRWIQKEIDGAKRLRRPILGVNLWGSVRKSSVVGNAADEMVGWTQDSVVNGIWQLYRRYY